MGIIVSIYRRTPAGRYELGKSKACMPRGEPPCAPLRASPDSKRWQEWHTAFARYINPAYFDLWSIMGSDSYRVFRLDDSDQERVAKCLLGCQSIEDIDMARKVAKDLIAWSRGSDLLLIPDNDAVEDILKRFDFPVRHRETGNIWKAMS